MKPTCSNPPRPAAFPSRRRCDAAIARYAAAPVRVVPRAFLEAVYLEPVRRLAAVASQAR